MAWSNWWAGVLAHHYLDGGGCLSSFLPFTYFPLLHTLLILLLSPVFFAIFVSFFSWSTCKVSDNTARQQEEA
jgi:hypothetical protein